MVVAAYRTKEEEGMSSVDRLGRGKEGSGS